MSEYSAAFIEALREHGALYGQKIDGPNGSVSINGCFSAQEAVRKAVDLAIQSGWRPPRWYEFWLPSWSGHCRREYRRRMEAQDDPA